MRPPEIKKVTIRLLRKELLAKKFAIPKLQRNFVWDARRAAKLLDSMFYNIPVGSLFVWEMDKASAHLINKAEHALPQHNPTLKTIWLVIDGQQRISVLYRAFEGGMVTNDSGKRIDFDRLCFVVNPDKHVDRPQRIVHRKPVDAEFVALKDILAADWRGRMPTKTKGFLAKVKDCRDRLLSYPIPLVHVTGATLEEIGEAFIRVNSQGMKITTADRAIALMGEVDVRAMAENVRGAIREKRFDLGSLDSILMGFNLAVEKLNEDGDPPKLEAMARRWTAKIKKDLASLDEFKKLWTRFRAAFLSAVDYLRKNFPLHGPDYLPSANMVATLSVFFFNHKGQPMTKQRGEIRKWFWATGVANRYSGRGYHRNIVKDAKFFAALARGKSRRFGFVELLDPQTDLLAEQYSAQSSLTRAFFCLLALKKPTYLDSGEDIPLGDGTLSHANKTHRHHIFPQAQLQGHFSAKVYNRLCNICFLVARDNQSIGMKLPRSYLAETKMKHQSRFATIMQSHLIPAAPTGSIWMKGTKTAFKKFQQQRLQLICCEFEKAAGMKLFAKK